MTLDPSAKLNKKPAELNVTIAETLEQIVGTGSRYRSRKLFLTNHNETLAVT